MEKVKKCGLYAVAVVVYINIGLLVAYSFNSGVEQTAVTRVIHRLLDWWNIFALSMEPLLGWNLVGLVILWPMFVIIWLGISVICTISMVGIAIWAAIQWLLAGGFWQWLGVFRS